MKWCQRPLLTFTIYQTYLFSLFGVKEVISLYWLLGASLGLLEDANECSGREKVDQRREKDWDAVISREYAKRPHRDGDIVSIPSGEGRQDSCWDFFFFIPSSFFHLIVWSDRTACMTNFLHWLAPLCSLKHYSNTYLRERSGTSLISDLQVPASPLALIPNLFMLPQT